jgi:FkbM family methyltransferase
MIRLAWLGIFLLFGSLQAEEVSHQSRLTILKNKGFEPRVVYDIGAYHGDWSAEIKTIFKNAQFFLFEANENQKKYLEKRPFPFFIRALGDREEVVNFYSKDSTGDSLFLEQTQHYEEGKYTIKVVQMTTLENVVKENNLPLPDLVKIDVQGAEKLILQGSPSIIQHAEVVILETKILEYNQGAPLINEIMTCMDQLGFRMFDILELHYLPNRDLMEVDILFVKKESSLIKRGMLY